MISQTLLRWYDENMRHFPWRALPAQIPNPYHVYLSEIMLQQTTTTTVVPYFNRFIEKWPTVEHLAKASLDEVLHAWQGLGYYSRARNLHKCAQLIVEYWGGQFPSQEAELLSLPGIGPYTAAAIAAIAYDEQTSPVDGNIIRIMARLNALETPIPAIVPEVKKKLSELVPDTRNGDFVQALMDIGATICTPKAPQCSVCPIQQNCKAYEKGFQTRLPIKAQKRPRPVKHAVVFWIEDSKGRVWMQRRAEKGLLGGMMEFPSTPWLEQNWEAQGIDEHKPIAFKGERVQGKVEHTFTHFHLIMTVLRGKCDISFDQATWVARDQFQNYALPTLMKKVVKCVVQAGR